MNVNCINMRKYKNKTTFKCAFVSMVMLFGLLPVSQATETVDAELLDVMQWRMIGPYRGGRVMTVTGVPDKPQLYYMGSTGGGVWKTEDAGISWENISDGYFNVGTIGAIAVAESDTNVIYVGTGEKSIRGVMTSHGDGVYKSTDNLVNRILQVSRIETIRTPPTGIRDQPRPIHQVKFISLNS